MADFYYELVGDVYLKPEACPEAHAICRRFNDEAGEGLEAHVVEGANPYVSFSGGSYADALMIDKIAQELSPYVAEPANLAYVFGGTTGFVYIGPDKDEAKTLSASLLSKIKERYLVNLSEDDQDSLRAYLTPKPDDDKPICCPFCGSSRKVIVIDMVEWNARSMEERDNCANLMEHQCHNCEGRSFWT